MDDAPRVGWAARDVGGNREHALHAVRLRVPAAVHAAADRAGAAGEIMEALGLEQSNASQHLAVLRNKGVLVARRRGASVVHAVRDPMLYEILDLLRLYFSEHLTEIRGMLESLE